MWSRSVLLFPLARGLVSVVHAADITLETDTYQPKESLWRRLVWRNRDAVGLVEVTEGHSKYSTMNTIRAGLKLVSKVDSEHTESKVVLINAEGKEVVIESHESDVFRRIRAVSGVSDGSYWSDVTTESQKFLHINSNSGSGCDVYFTKSRQFVVKMERESEFNFFSRILNRYLSHLEKYPYSLLSRYMGRYTITLPDQKPVHFTVMLNICPPRDGAKRYDLKGCLVDRWQPPPKEEGVLAVLKDENFISDHIELGSNSDWFKRQYKIDIDFLYKEIGVTDYSLLVAYEVKDGARKKSSISKQNRVGSSRNLGIGYPGIGVALQKEAGDVTPAPPDTLPSPIATPVPTPMSGKPWMGPEVHAKDTTSDVSPPNARALPDVESALHAVEGPDRVYYFGLVDWFMDYGWTERWRRVKKTTKYFSDDHSTVPPRKYARRMLSSTFGSMR